MKKRDAKAESKKLVKERNEEKKISNEENKD